jgi:hypothetical protein
MKTIKEKWFFSPTVQAVNERLRAGERQDMDALQLRFHTEWLEDDSQVVDQIALVKLSRTKAKLGDA